jgi:NADPH-dependent 7-cyano-7-deazaguanine reductase QueF
MESQKKRTFGVFKEQVINQIFNRLAEKDMQAF